ncbi:MAG: hypothetical protein ACD_42C00456G0001 [uncultured bacterium]|nr:MAG: hypothetical protein ACD_42C00456G0001 [uncultured bacterium]
MAEPMDAMINGILRVSNRSDRYPAKKLEIIHPANVNDAPTAASLRVK